jgi:hypothetical protein
MQRSAGARVSLPHAPHIGPVFMLPGGAAQGLRDGCDSANKIAEINIRIVEAVFPRHAWCRLRAKRLPTMIERRVSPITFYSDDDHSITGASEARPHENQPSMDVVSTSTGAMPSAVLQSIQRLSPHGYSAAENGRLLATDLVPYILHSLHAVIEPTESSCLYNIAGIATPFTYASTSTDFTMVDASMRPNMKCLGRLLATNVPSADEVIFANIIDTVTARTTYITSQASALPAIGEEALRDCVGGLLRHHFRGCYPQWGPTSSPLKKTEAGSSL